MTRTQEIRKEVLLQLKAGMEVPSPTRLIVKRARNSGFDYGEQEIRDALYYLKGMGFVEAVRDPATNETKHRITSNGIAHYENNYAE